MKNDEAEKEEKEKEKESKSINKRWKAECGDGYWTVVDYGMPDWSYNYNRDMDSFRYDTHTITLRPKMKLKNTLMFLRLSDS